jgi:hypothetical protein
VLIQADREQSAIRIMTDLLYQRLQKRWEEVTDLPTQQLGPFTSAYKVVTKRLKVMPWPLLVLISIAVVFGMYVILGSTVTFLASILQRGF